MTKVFVDTYKGKKVFGVWEVDGAGEKTGKYPLISFGIKKAEALQKHIQELPEFIKELKVA